MAFTYELKADEITLKWEKPNNNGAEITMYTVYYGTQSDEQWKEIKKITDVSVRKYVVRDVMGKKYKVLVTASNKYGESSEEGMVQRVDVLEGGLSASLTKRVHTVDRSITFICSLTVTLTFSDVHHMVLFDEPYFLLQSRGLTDLTNNTELLLSLLLLNQWISEWP